MITQKTRLIGGLATTYFSARGFDVHVDVNVFFDYVKSLIKKTSLIDNMFKGIVQDRLYILSDFLVSCADFPDVGRCERRRDRLYERVWTEIDFYLRPYLKKEFGVIPEVVIDKLSDLDNILETAISMYLARGKDSPTDALFDALKKLGYRVSDSDNVLDALYSIVYDWFGRKEQYMRAFVYLLLVVNYAMAFVLVYLEENKS
ncbi:MAG: hypothetical protein GXO59_04365 [Dictyoglomi bacterium]|nr:hypothetical protein [Dictyoglomota bacterium]